MAIALSGGSTASTSTITASPTVNRAVTVPDADFTITGNDLTQTLTNKTISSGVLTGTLTAGGSVGALNNILISTGTGVQWSAPAATGVVSISFGTTGLTPNTATNGAVSVAGTLANTNGGTGQSSAFNQYGVTYASTTTALDTTSAGTTTTVLHGNASGAPTFGAVSLTADVSGTLANTNGGTGQSSAFTQYGVTYASTATALATSAAGTSSQVLHGNASGAPTFGAVSLTADVSGTLPAGNGGTGVANNAASTLTISGAFGTTLTVSAATSVTLPTTGTLATLSGTETFANKTLTNPTVTNYVETPFSANSSTAITLDLVNGTVQIITLTGNAVFTFPAVVSGKSFIMFLKQDGTGSRTVTFPSVTNPVKWAGGSAPTITATAGRQDILSFFSDGTNWYGVTVGQNYTP